MCKACICGPSRLSSPCCSKYITTAVWSYNISPSGIYAIRERYWVNGCIFLDKRFCLRKLSIYVWMSVGRTKGGVLRHIANFRDGNRVLAWAIISWCLCNSAICNDNWPQLKFTNTSTDFTCVPTVVGIATCFWCEVVASILNDPRVVFFSVIIHVRRYPSRMFHN